MIFETVQISQIRDDEIEVKAHEAKFNKVNGFAVFATFDGKYNIGMRVNEDPKMGLPILTFIALPNDGAEYNDTSGIVDVVDKGFSIRKFDDFIMTFRFKTDDNDIRSLGVTYIKL